MSSLGLAACAGGSAPSPTTTLPSRLLPGSSTTISLYWIRGGQALGVSHRRLSSTRADGITALNEVLDGTNGAESSAGLTNEIPGGSKLLGLSTKNGVATADFNSSFARSGSTFSFRARVAQVVFTLTQFPGTSKVLIEVNGTVEDTLGNGAVKLGRALGRTDEVALLPPIFLEDPAVGDIVHSPLRLAGLANTFEATFEVQILGASGHALAKATVRATAGTGTWGSFESRLRYNVASTVRGTIAVFELSAKDGRPIHKVEVPVTIAP